jgi:hypothetical protein
VEDQVEVKDQEEEEPCDRSPVTSHQSPVWSLTVNGNQALSIDRSEGKTRSIKSINHQSMSIDRSREKLLMSTVRERSQLRGYVSVCGRNLLVGPHQASRQCPTCICPSCHSRLPGFFFRCQKIQRDTALFHRKNQQLYTVKHHQTNTEILRKYIESYPRAVNFNGNFDGSSLGQQSENISLFLDSFPRERDRENVEIDRFDRSFVHDRGRRCFFIINRSTSMQTSIFCSPPPLLDCATSLLAFIVSHLQTSLLFFFLPLVYYYYGSLTD